MSTLSRLYRATATRSNYDTIFLILLLSFELVISIGIVRYVPYTEIDWKAYMQEVEAWLDGETNYMNIRGDTGPLVYPAGFLYLFALLRWLTDEGKNIAKAQSIFIGFYWIQQFVILLIYQERFSWIRSRCKEKDDATLAHQVWAWRGAMAITCFSKRIHSIFLLRLFNDGPTMLLLYISVLLFMRHRWNVGCVVFSLAVSMKMNVLLFAPGLLLLLLQASPNLKTVILRLGLGCALPQLILGAPFLTTYPVSYLRKAFELDRVFFYKWTVNWKFLPEDLFLAKSVSFVLLLCHLCGLGILSVRWLRAAQKQASRRIFLHEPLSSHYIAYTMFVSNFVGIAFARTLHYQFYSWYFAALPYLLWSPTNGDSFAMWAFRLLPIAGVEIAFLTFPATPWSSAILQLSHVAVLLSIQPPLVIDAEQATKAVETARKRD
ncbi:alpha-1,3-mannosyltransferase [Fistulifera solaris]|uniref:dolichyl-P-Man:Man5GlcNAc2-PP-dolichol alpha-1,3-mannosyltransferase n=1 Tax=Fistulifera solaris TaxID=1519565 RepID=A0A1Z5JWF0_FISSO|nr:alpha-1,3-mannosyltransferase [Fistulifera solaris]|eukprot:GAX18365.1 alpha-1,3-mannosyltransferase [Fistulifera solaris]